MRYVEPEASDRRYSKIGLGTWQFGSREWAYGSDYAETEAARIVRRALELGVNLFDTAELYGRGKSEQILGRALRTGMEETGTARGDVVVATKITPVLPIAPVVQQRGVASAARLGTGTIDLYQVHQANPVVRDDTTMRGMRALQRTGVVRDVGVSNYSTARWRRAEAMLGRPVLSNQVEYSLLARDPEREMLAYAAQTNRLVIAYSPLAQGLLSGKYNEDNRPRGDVRVINPLFLPEVIRSAQPLLDRLAEVADAHDVTSAQIALAWSIHHPQVVAIPGASSVAQLESNVAAAEIVLADDEYRALATAAQDVRRPGRARVLQHVARERLGRRTPGHTTG